MNNFWALNMYQHGTKWLSFITQCNYKKNIPLEPNHVPVLNGIENLASNIQLSYNKTDFQI